MLTGQTPFSLIYGVEAMMPMEYIVPSLHIAALTGVMDREAPEERLAQFFELEEERFLAGFHQQVQKQREKAWHDQNIKLHTFKVNDLVLFYDTNSGIHTIGLSGFHLPWLSASFVIHSYSSIGKDAKKISWIFVYR